MSIVFSTDPKLYLTPNKLIPLTRCNAISGVNLQVISVPINDSKGWICVHLSDGELKIKAVLIGQAYSKAQAQGLSRFHIIKVPEISSHLHSIQEQHSSDRIEAAFESYELVTTSFLYMIGNPIPLWRHQQKQCLGESNTMAKKPLQKPIPKALRDPLTLYQDFSHSKSLPADFSEFSIESIDGGIGSIPDSLDYIGQSSRMNSTASESSDGSGNIRNHGIWTLNEAKKMSEGSSINLVAVVSNPGELKRAGNKCHRIVELTDLKGTLKLRLKEEDAENFQFQEGDVVFWRNLKVVGSEGELTLDYLEDSQTVSNAQSKSVQSYIDLKNKCELVKNLKDSESKSTNLSCLRDVQKYKKTYGQKVFYVEAKIISYEPILNEPKGSHKFKAHLEDHDTILSVTVIDPAASEMLPKESKQDWELLIEKMKQKTFLMRVTVGKHMFGRVERTVDKASVVLKQD